MKAPAMTAPVGTYEGACEKRMMFEGSSPRVGLELGYQARAALQHIQARALLAIRVRATFRPVHDDQVAPVLPCEACRDGGLRVVGSVRGRGSWQRAHVCDTCGALKLFDIPGPPAA